MKIMTLYIWTVIIIEEFHYCLLHIKLFQTYFYQELLHTQMKSLANINKDLGGINRTSTTHLAFGECLKRCGNTITRYASYL